VKNQEKWSGQRASVSISVLLLPLAISSRSEGHGGVREGPAEGCGDCSGQAALLVAVGRVVAVLRLAPPDNAGAGHGVLARTLVKVYGKNTVP
jgi:hypothetical protein